MGTAVAAGQNPEPKSIDVEVIYGFQAATKCTGEEIAYLQLPKREGQALVLATKSGKLLVALMTADYDDDGDFEVDLRPVHAKQAFKLIEKDATLRRELSELGMFDIAAYFAKEAAEREERLEKARIANEKRERELYLKLKEKYGE